MNATDRFESELAAWLIDTAVPMTLDDIDPIVELTAGVRQRPRWTFPGRWLPMRATTLGRQLRTPPWRVIAVLAALLILVAALLAIRAGSQPNVLDAFGLARNGLVVYGTGGDIVTVDPETGEIETLVGGVDDDTVPIYSRDGTRIAFLRSVAGEQTLVIVSADGSGLRELTDPIDIRSPTWSPDGSEIAFANGDLMVVATDGSGMRRLDLEGVGAQFAQWRPPDGRQIMFTDGSDGVSLYLVGRDETGLAPIRLADGSRVTDPAIGWTPDGTRLVTLRETAAPEVGRSRLHVLTVADDGLVTGDSMVGPPHVNGPFVVGLSPDGSKATVAAAETVDGDEWRVAVVPVDGSPPVVTTGPTFIGDNYQFGWSPDGQIIYVKDVAQDVTWLLDPDGGEARQATWHDPSDELVVWQRRAP